MQQIIDFRTPCWGHVYHGSGLCHSHTKFNNGDFFVLKQEDGDTVFKALEVKSVENPKDMYEVIFYQSVGILESAEELNLDFLNSIELENNTVF